MSRAGPRGLRATGLRRSPGGFAQVPQRHLQKPAPILQGEGRTLRSWCHALLTASGGQMGSGAGARGLCGWVPAATFSWGGPVALYQHDGLSGSQATQAGHPPAPRGPCAPGRVPCLAPGRCSLGPSTRLSAFPQDVPREGQAWTVREAGVSPAGWAGHPLTHGCRLSVPAPSSGPLAQRV